MTIRLVRALASTHDSRRPPQACLSDVYDVTRGWDFYGPDGPYNKFAGR